MARVIDRLFLVLFTLACVIGSCTIILKAPYFYDATPALHPPTGKPPYPELQQLAYNLNLNTD